MSALGLVLDSSCRNRQSPVYQQRCQSELLKERSCSTLHPPQAIEMEKTPKSYPPTQTVPTKHQIQPIYPTKEMPLLYNSSVLCQNFVRVYPTTIQLLPRPLAS